MARIDYPNSFLGWFELIKKIVAKFTADGVSSPLHPILNQNTIDLDDDLITANAAKDEHDAAQDLEGGAEKLNKDRDNLFNPVVAIYKKMVQFLKHLYNRNPNELQLWSVQVDNDNRVVYPEDFIELKENIIDFIDKHESYTPPTSPLQPYITQHSIDMTQLRADADTAEALHNDFLNLSAQKETAYAQRDILIEPVITHVREIGQFLMHLNTDNPNRTSEHGYKIDHSPKGDKIRNYTISTGTIKTVTNVKKGSKVINTGPLPVLLRPGNDPAATPVSLNPQQEFTIIRGFSKLLAENANTSGDAIIQVTINL